MNFFFSNFIYGDCQELAMEDWTAAKMGTFAVVENFHATQPAHPPIRIVLSSQKQ